MASSWAQQIANGTHLPSDYSSLHQQRRYLLEQLANCESRGEHLANVLKVTRLKLDIANSSADDADNIKALKKKLKSLGYHLKHNQKTGKSLAENLALLAASMNRMEQTQWRRASSEYNQTLQYGHFDSLAAGIQNMGLVSPVTPGLPTPNYSSGFVSPMSPVLVPWMAAYPVPSESHQLLSPTQMLQSLYGVPYGQATSQQTFQREESFGDDDATMQLDTNTCPLQFPVHDFVPAQRSLSLPDINAAQQNSPEDDRFEGVTSTQPSGGETMTLKRQLSLADHGSSALRLQRKFR